MQREGDELERTIHPLRKQFLDAGILSGEQYSSPACVFSKTTNEKENIQTVVEVTFDGGPVKLVITEYVQTQEFSVQRGCYTFMVISNNTGPYSLLPQAVAYIEVPITAINKYGDTIELYTDSETGLHHQSYFPPTTTDLSLTFTPHTEEGPLEQ